MKQTIKKHVSEIQTTCSNCLALTAASDTFFGPFCHLLYDPGLKFAETVQLQVDVLRKAPVHPFYGEPEALALVESLHYLTVQGPYIYSFKSLDTIGFHYMIADLPKVALKDILVNLTQARKTENAFMSSKYKPPLVVKVDGLAEDFASPSGRSRLIKEYLDTAEDGEPWIIPADLIDVKEIRPLSLSDLAKFRLLSLEWERTILTNGTALSTTR